jgi:hypothetical protein
MAEEVFAGAIKLLLGDESEDSSLVDPDEGLITVGVMTDFPARSFIAYGEAVVRFDQISSGEDQIFKRRIYSPELDLASSLASLGSHCEFFTVIPPGTLGELVRTVCQESNVVLRPVLAEEGNHMGDMTVTRSQDDEYRQTVHQRRYSAFHNTTAHFRWEKGILSDRAPCWIHSCLSSFVWTQNGLGHWTRLVEAALDPKRSPEDIFVSLELRSSECAAPFPEIWKFLLPVVSKMYMLILSPEEVLQVVSIMGIESAKMRGRTSGDADVQPWVPLVDTLRRKIHAKCIVVPFLYRAESVRFIVSHDIGLTLVTPNAFTTVTAYLAKLVHALMQVGALEDKERFQSLINDLNWGKSGNVPAIVSPTSLKEINRKSIVKQVIDEMSD